LLRSRPATNHRWGRNSLAVFLRLVAAAAFYGARSAPDAGFAALDKPTFNPPNWIVGSAWTTLHILMAIAARQVFRKPGIGFLLVLDAGIWKLNPM
jgi:tryptophan-rich sensory protein